jgi:DNA-binding NarL/FixJ family response regulator
VKIRNYLATIVLISTALFFAYDIVADLLDEDGNRFHIALEAVVFLAVSLMLARELSRVRQLNKTVSEQQSRMARLSGDLMIVMETQFRQWSLSPSESEVALLLIKGLSMKEISELRDVKEKTVRQQATSIYAKPGYAGRHELAAHFIEDLMNVSSN